MHSAVVVHIIIDINECSEGSDNCDQTCANTVGSFTCSCADGFQLSSDGRTCNGNYRHLYTDYFMICGFIFIRLE